LAEFSYNWEISKFLITEAPYEIISSIFKNKDCAEFDIGYAPECMAPTPVFMAAVREMIRDTQSYPDWAKKVFSRNNKEPITWKEINFTSQDLELLLECCNLLKAKGIDVRTFPIVKSNDLGKSTFARASNGKIWLTAECFESKEFLLEILLEEYIHLAFRVTDFTREMQNATFKLWVQSLLKGE
jgi:hypothetical protein